MQAFSARNPRQLDGATWGACYIRNVWYFWVFTSSCRVIVVVCEPAKACHSVRGYVSLASCNAFILEILRMLHLSSKGYIADCIACRHLVLFASCGKTNVTTSVQQHERRFPLVGVPQQVRVRNDGWKTECRASPLRLQLDSVKSNSMYRYRYCLAHAVTTQLSCLGVLTTAGSGASPSALVCGSCYNNNVKSLQGSHPCKSTWNTRTTWPGLYTVSAGEMA